MPSLQLVGHAYELTLKCALLIWANKTPSELRKAPFVHDLEELVRTWTESGVERRERIECADLVRDFNSMYFESTVGRYMTRYPDARQVSGQWPARIARALEFIASHTDEVMQLVRGEFIRHGWAFKEPC